jgi:simple sugar transport system ATP-binding protein
MVGERLRRPERAAVADTTRPRLEISHLSLPATSRFGTSLRDISFRVRGGEIVGIAGVAGNGQSELMAALIGERTLPHSAETIRIDGTAVAHRGPRARRALGAAFVPEERHGHGAVAAMRLDENAFLTAFSRLGLAVRGLISARRTREFTERVIQGFDVRTRGVAAEAGSLSGGNLQKFIVGREILQRPGVLVIAQPTWGVDAGAAAAIHQALIDLAARGTAVLAISQDLDELFVICDRIGVISEGRLSPPRPAGELDARVLGLLMGGVHGAGDGGAEASGAAAS